MIAAGKLKKVMMRQVAPGVYQKISNDQLNILHAQLKAAVDSAEKI